MAKPPIGPANPPPREVYRIIIDLGVEDGMLSVKPTQNAIQTLGMLTLATADIIARLRQTPEEPKIIIPNLRIKGKIEA